MTSLLVILIYSAEVFTTSIFFSFVFSHQYCILLVLNVLLPEFEFPSGINKVTIKLAVGTSWLVTAPGLLLAGGEWHPMASCDARRH